MPNILVWDNIGVNALPIDLGDAISVTDSLPQIIGLGGPPLSVTVNDAVTLAESVGATRITDSPYRQGKLANSHQVTLDMAVLNRNTLAAFIRWQSATITLNSVTDTSGNTYTLVQNPITSGSGYRAAMAVARDVVGGAVTVIANFSSDPAGKWIGVHEVTQRDLILPVDGSAGQAQDFPSGTDGVSSGPFTTSRDAGYLFGGTTDGGFNSLVQVGTNFIERLADIPSQVGFVTEDQVQTMAGATSVTFTYAANATITLGLSLRFARFWLPNLSDTVTVTESTPLAIPLLPVVSDALSVAEFVDLRQFPGTYTVSDSVTVTEMAFVNLASFPGLTISVFDNVVLFAISPIIAQTEAITVTDLILIRLTGIQAADSITVSDSVFVARLGITINVFDEVFLVMMAESWDTVTLTEQVTLSFVTFGSKAINTAEANVFITELVNLVFSRLPASTFDSLAVTDASTLLVAQNRPSVFDAVTLAELVAASLRSDINASVFDAVTVTENTTLTLATAAGARVIAVSDSVTVSEFVMLALNIAGVFDAVTVAENTQVTLSTAAQRAITVNDALTVAESTALIFQTNPLASVFDAVTVTDVPTIAVAFLKIAINDAVTVTDQPSLSLPGIQVSTSDAVTLTESVAGKLSLLRLSALENVSVGEGRDMALNPLLFDVFDLVGIAEDATSGEAVVGERFPEPRIRGCFPWERWIRR